MDPSTERRTRRRGHADAPGAAGLDHDPAFLGHLQELLQGESHVAAVPPHLRDPDLGYSTSCTTCSATAT